MNPLPIPSAVEIKSATDMPRGELDYE